MTRIGLLCLTLLACGAPVARPSDGPIAPRDVTPFEHHAGHAKSKRLRFDVRASARLAGRRATVTWTLTVANRVGHSAREAEFVLVAPPGIAIDRLALDVVPGTLTEGRVAPALSAAAVYERVTRQIIDPALIERIDAQRYRLRIFPLNRPRTVRLRYHAILPATIQGMLLDVPRPFVVGEEDAWPDAMQLEIERAGQAVRRVRGLGAVLPFGPGRTESVADGHTTLTQFQRVPAAPVEAQSVETTVVAFDHGRETQAHRARFSLGRRATRDPRLKPYAVVHGAGDWAVRCADLYCQPQGHLGRWARPPRYATDLVRLVHAAHPLAARYDNPLVVVTAGRDRWHDVEWLARAFADKGPIHFLALGRWRNTSGLAWLAEATDGHFVQHRDDVRTATHLSEPKITDLRIEMLEGQAEWAPLPRSHVAGTPIVLTARHAGPIRARLHGRLADVPIAVDLTARATPGDESIKALWFRAHLDALWAAGEPATVRRAIAMREGLVSRTTSRVVFEREQDYAEAATPLDRSTPPAPPTPQRVIVNSSRIVILDKVYFRTGSATVRPPSLPIIDALAEVLAQYPEIEFAICGHTDNREGAADRLGGRRAVAVARALIARGVDPARLSLISYGADRPIHHNKTRDGRAHNRRVEFYITRADGRREPLPGARPLRFSAAERLAVARMLLAADGLPGNGDLAALRARMTLATQVRHARWLHTPEELDAFLQGVDAKQLDAPSTARLARLLAERSMWDRVHRLRLGEHLTDDELLVFLKRPDARRCAPHPRCVRLIDAISAVNPGVAHRIVRAALQAPRSITPAILRRATPAQVETAISALIARPTVTEADFRTAAIWAAYGRLDRLACQALARAVSLSRTVTVPLADGVPMACLRVGLNQRQPGWRRAHVVHLQRPAQVVVGGRLIQHLPSDGPTLVLDLPPTFEIVWQGGAYNGSVTHLTPRDVRSIRLEADDRRVRFD